MRELQILLGVSIVGWLVFSPQVLSTVWHLNSLINPTDEKPDFEQRSRFLRSVLLTGLILQPALKRTTYPLTWLPAIIVGPPLAYGIWVALGKFPRLGGRLRSRDNKPNP